MNAGRNWLRARLARFMFAATSKLLEQLSRNRQVPYCRLFAMIVMLNLH
jgi:hypothetical protein